MKFYTKKEIDEFLKESDEFKPLEFKKPELVDLNEWVRDEHFLQGHELFVSYEFGKSISLVWLDPKLPTELDFDTRHDYTSKNIAFSPQGGFLYGFQDGRLITCEPYSNKYRLRFDHPGMTHVTISPKDNYIVTYSTTLPSRANIIVWDVRFSRGTKSFTLRPETVERVKATLQTKKTMMPTGEQLVQFSHDERFLARISEADRNSVELYVTPTFELYNKQLVVFDKPLSQISWSRTANVLLAYHEHITKKSQESVFFFYNADKSAMVMRHIMYNVRNPQFYWHPTQPKLVVKCDTPKGFSLHLFTFAKGHITITNHEYAGVTFRMLEMNPVRKEFGLLTATVPKKLGDIPQPIFQLFDISDQNMRACARIRSKEVRTISFAPNGRFIILNGIGTTDPYVYFYGIDALKGKQSKRAGRDEDREGDVEGPMVLYKRVAIDKFDYLQWDPLGYYVFGVRSAFYDDQQKNGFILFDAYGTIRCQRDIMGFAGLLFRPQPQPFHARDRTREIKARYAASLEEMKDIDRKQKEAMEEAIHQRKAEELQRFQQVILRNLELNRAQKVHVADERAFSVVEEEQVKHVVRG